MTSEQAEEMLSILRAIARKIGARAPGPRRAMTDEERSGWKEVNRGVGRGLAGDPAGEFPTSTTTRERFFEEGG